MTNPTKRRRSKQSQVHSQLRAEVSAALLAHQKKIDILVQTVIQQHENIVFLSEQVDALKEPTKLPDGVAPD